MASSKKRRNGYYYFMLEVKNEMQRDGKLLPMKEIAQLAGPKWDQLSESEKASYKEMARTEKEQGSSSSPFQVQQGLGSSSRSKETGKTKRKTTGFFLYMKDIQAELEFEAGTFLYMDEIADLAGPRWSQLSLEKRETYKAMAKSQRNPPLSSPIRK